MNQRFASITKSVENFAPIKRMFGKVTLIDAYDSFTHNLVNLFLKLGANVSVLRSKEITIDIVDQELGEYLVFSPGPGTPSDAGLYKPLILKYFGKIPILGVCLGMQAINEVFGGITKRAPYVMHGKVSKIIHDSTGVFSNVQNPTTVARYHSLACYDISPKFSIQASVDNIPMAIHISEKIAAVQFHPESFLTEDGPRMIKNFLELRF
jgi:anthranilate synthase component 2